jgi:hypothetical protein
MYYSAGHTPSTHPVFDHQMQPDVSTMGCDGLREVFNTDIKCRDELCKARLRYVARSVRHIQPDWPRNLGGMLDCSV